MEPALRAGQLWLWSRPLVSADPPMSDHDMTCAKLREDIDSFLDGELDASRANAIEAHAAVCPTCASRLSGERRVRARIAHVCAGETAPAALRRRVRAQVDAAQADRGVAADAPARVTSWSRPGRRTFGYGLAAAAVIAVLAIVWTLGPRGGVGNALAAGLAEDHAGHHGPSQREGVFRSADRVELGRWFEGQLGMPIAIPGAPAGARLIGGQVCVVDGRRVAHAVYDVNGLTVSYFVVPHVSGPDEPTEGRVQDLNYVAWNSEPGGVFVLGSAPSRDLISFRLQ
jgi:mycothiol system anti-sigma-R factor